MLSLRDDLLEQVKELRRGLDGLTDRPLLRNHLLSVIEQIERKVATLDGPVTPVVAGAGEVVVWGFRKYEVAQGAYATAAAKASLETIESIGGEAILGTDQVVKIASLDGNGLALPQARN